jgi:hypothetical protein
MTRKLATGIQEYEKVLSQFSARLAPQVDMFDQVRQQVKAMADDVRLGRERLMLSIEELRREAQGSREHVTSQIIHHFEQSTTESNRVTRASLGELSRQLTGLEQRAERIAEAVDGNGDSESVLTVLADMRDTLRERPLGEREFRGGRT